MKTSKLIFLSFALALPALADDPKYLGAAPKSYCMSGEAVAAKVKSCNDNSVFLQALKQCFDDFKQLRKSTTADLEKRYGTAGGQKGDFASHAQNTKEAAAAHDYLIAVGEMATKELDEYFDWIEHPDDAMNDNEIMAEPCFMENASAMDKLLYEFEDEVTAMKKARQIEAAHSAISGKNVKKIDASSIPGAPPVVHSTHGKGSADVTGTPKKGIDSGVSGLKEQKAREQQK